MNGKKHLTGTLLLLCSCATVDPGPNYERAATLVRDATGTSTVYSPAMEEETKAQVEALLGGELTISDAVEVALLNNPTLQASFFRIGVSHAELVQAGLLPNPVLGFAFRFPSGGGLTELEGDLVQEIASLWQMPARKRVASRELEQSILEVARQAVTLASQTKRAYFMAVAASELRSIAKENVTIAEQLHAVAMGREEAGAGNILDVNFASSELKVRQLAERDAALGEHESLQELSLLLGLFQPARRARARREAPGAPFLAGARGVAFFHRLSEAPRPQSRLPSGQRG